MEISRDFFIFPQDYFFRHDDWYIRIKYYDYYCASLVTEDMRNFTYNFKSYGTKKQCAEKLGTTEKTLRKSILEKDSWSFQKIVNSYLILPRRYVHKLVDVVDSGSKTNSQIMMKCFIWLTSQVYDHGELIGSEESFARQLGVYKDTISIAIDKLMDNNIIKRTKTGNSIQKIGSTYIFC